MYYRFLDCELDERSRTLRRAGVEVSLEPKAFAFLIALIENRDRVVSRRELFERLWPDQFVGDAALSRCVSVARRAVGDTGRSLRAIQTFHRYGYRFIAAVSSAAENAGAADTMEHAATEFAARYPLAGRAGEIERLHAAWEDAVGGQRRLALVSGEPGIGKTRLAQELAARVRTQAGTVLHGACVEVAALPFQPFTEALRAFLEAQPAQDLLDRIDGCRLELARLVPEMSAVLGVSARATADVALDRQRLFNAILRWLDVASECGPVLLVLEDLHWASRQTLLLLHHVVRSPSAQRLLILATYRDTDVQEAQPGSEILASFDGEPGVVRVPLEGLDVAAVEMFLSAAGGAALAPFAGDLAHLVWRRSGGNPFFLRELACGLREADVASAPPERLFEAARSGLTAGVRTLVRQRLRRLAADSARVLPLASVAGYEFRFGLLAEIAALSEDRLLAALDEGVRARLVEATAPGTYRFSHHIVREVLYEEIGEARRAALHLRIAQAIESLHGPRVEAHLGALAHHYERAAAAGGRAKAVEYAVRAAEHAVASLAHGLAALHYRRAIGLLDETADPRQKVRLLLRLGETLRDGGEPDFARPLLEAARLAEETGDGESLVRAALANTRGFASEIGVVDAERVAVIEAALGEGAPEEGEARARLLALLASELAFSADTERPRALADEALAMARRLGERRTLAYVLARRHLVVATPDTLEERVAHSAELGALADELADPRTRHWALASRAAVSVEAGNAEELERTLDLCAQMVAEVGHPFLRWGLLRLDAQRALLAGRVADAEARIAEAFEVGRASGQPDAALLRDYQLLAVRRVEGRLAEMEPVVRRLVDEHPGLPVLRAVAAAFYCEIDRAEEARPFVESVRASFDRVPRDVNWLATMTGYACAVARLREKREAALLYSHLSPFPRHVESSWGTVGGCVAHYLGLLAAALGRWEDAEHRFDTAREVHSRLEARYWMVATEIEHGRLQIARAVNGDEANARRLLAAAAERAHAHGFTALERDAIRLLPAAKAWRQGDGTLAGAAKADRPVVRRAPGAPRRPSIDVRGARRA
jgi:DNA-binding winged helix-turn-helix (wHTH) protein